MNGPRQFVFQCRIDRPLARQPALARERFGHNSQVEVALSAWFGIHTAFVMMTGVPRAVVFEL